ncbi:alpha/beta fold hydrolase [Pseudomonas sp. X10]
MKTLISAIALAFGLMLSIFTGTAFAQDVAPIEAKSVVLVHGAWADGSSWADVIPYLRAAGLKVISVQNPLTSLSDDAAAAKRALSSLDGPTVLVGHSYAGNVITEVGGDSRVTGLVYVAARAPDAGEDFTALAGKFPTMPVRAGVEEHDGFLTVGEDAFLSFFADGVPAEKAKTLFAVQQPIAATLFSDRTTTAAWRSKPSWYAVSKNDNTTSPDLQRFLAKRMNATTVEIESGHLSLVSHPKEIADLILAAAGKQPR